MSLEKSKRYAVILCGGFGSRLWPLSRAIRPKQLLALNGEKTLLQQTALRLKKLVNPANLYTVTHESHKFEVLGQLSEVLPEYSSNVMSEPEAKNTLPAIALATYNIYKKDKEAVVGIFASDHSIKNDEKFVAAWKSAETIAEDNFLVLIGIKPDNPATGYGYIKPNKKISIKADLDIYEVDSFIEKPNINDAMKYVDDGYLWNSGMFVFKAKVFMDLLKKYQLEMYNSLLNVSDTNIKDVYASFPNLSMDYGLAEKVKKIAVVPVGMGWNDLGSWNSIYENGQKDKDGNLCHGTVFNLDTKDSLIWSEDNLIATIGLSNIIAVQTSDAILISDRNRSEEIKLLVENLRRSNPKVIEENVTIYRPWGAYQVLSENENFKVKRIIVKPKSKLSLQMHKYRSEHWVVVSGTATIINNNNEKSTLKINESTYIPKEQKHRLMNDTDSDLIIIEVQCGEYVGEDDILRFDDFYGRETDG